MGSLLNLPGSVLITLAAVPVTFLATVGIGRWLRRNRGVRLGFVFRLFCVAFAVWLPFTVLAHFDPGNFPTDPKDDWMKHLTAVVWILGTLFFLALLRRYFWELWFERTHQTRAPKFLSQIVGLLIFIVSVLIVVSKDYGISVPGLVAGSTVVAAILGFALQDLLGNIIAGVALELGKPFKPGDWLIVDGHSLEVIEVNWRSTRLRNNDDVYLDIPNKAIAGSTITNLTYPTRQHALRLRLGFEHGVPPNAVKDCLRRAAMNGRGVLSTPAPRAFLRDFTESTIVYELKFWIEDESQQNDIFDSVRTNIWYEAQRNRIRLPVAVRALHIEKRRERTQEAMEIARAAIRRQPFFKMLDEHEIETLLNNAKVLRFGRGEKVIEQGANGRSMFLLLEGEADVIVRANGTETRVATLQPGDYCGEMSLLTGEPTTATVIARDDCQMWEIDKLVLGDLLQENQVLVTKLGEMLAKRRMETEGVLASALTNGHRQAKEKEYTESFLKRLYSFFEL
jgi:small-conductance mechanosensitive channel/CRP-like cAMP-binding protein